MTRSEVEAAITALGRPTIVLNKGLRGVSDSRTRALTWDAEHPKGATAYRELCAVLAEMDEHQRGLEQAHQMVLALQRELAKSTQSKDNRPVDALASLRDEPALRFTRAWLGTTAAWLVLFGDTSQGKTVAGVWAMREVLLKGGTAAYRTAEALAKLSGFDEGAKERAALAKVDLLVVDEIGSEKATDWGQSQLHGLLDSRHMGRKRTILCSNLKLEVLRARLGERVNERIREDGSVHSLEGPSLRRRKGAANG